MRRDLRAVTLSSGGGLGNFVAVSDLNRTRALLGSIATVDKASGRNVPHDESTLTLIDVKGQVLVQLPGK